MTAFSGSFPKFSLEQSSSSKQEHSNYSSSNVSNSSNNICAGADEELNIESVCLFG